ncbi:MAG TPA: outer membrane lipid asymmetry maintenance protein MlaD [Alphaproteobacteria bacterium]|nr:outer membrane lipid asymmetry maintenance protein MlaD [Alphaproteobacteria bacterium]
MTKNYFETFVGFSVIFIAIYFILFAMNNTGTKNNYGYSLNITFDRVDGLAVGSDVKISGLKVGTVTEASIDAKTYLAKIIINIRDDVKIPADSTAEIISSGLLGDKYIALVPGGDDEYLKNGDKISFSQSSISIESLISKFMFSSDNKEKKSEKDELETDDIFK